MARYRRMLLSLLAVIVFVLNSASAADAVTSSKVKPHTYVRVFYYREGKRARESFLAHPRSIDIFAPQSYGLDDNGVLEGSIDPDLVAFAKTNAIRVMPLVTNKKFNKVSGQGILDDPAKQDAAISALATEALKQGFWGWQFDFEQLDASYRDKYSAFIKKASETLKSNNLKTSVAVVAQVSSDPGDYKENLWQNLIGVYDYAALASSTDFVTVMAYDDPDSKGPVARYSWVKRVIQYSLHYIPSEKLSLGIPFYYWKWSDATKKLVAIGGWQGLKNVFNKYGPTPKYSTVEQSPYIRYTAKKKHYTIWYENARSIQKKLDLVTSYHLHGFSAWALGLEIPDIHRIMKR